MLLQNYRLSKKATNNKNNNNTETVLNFHLRKKRWIKSELVLVSGARREEREVIVEENKNIEQKANDCGFHKVVLR